MTPRVRNHQSFVHGTQLRSTGRRGGREGDKIKKTTRGSWRISEKPATATAATTTQTLGGRTRTTTTKTTAAADRVVCPGPAVLLRDVRRYIILYYSVVVFTIVCMHFTHRRRRTGERVYGTHRRVALRWFSLVSRGTYVVGESYGRAAATLFTTITTTTTTTA